MPLADGVILLSDTSPEAEVLRTLSLPLFISFGVDQKPKTLLFMMDRYSLTLSVMEATPGLIGGLFDDVAFLSALSGCLSVLF